MNKIIKYILVVLMLVVIIAAAAIAYGMLSEQYVPDVVSETAPIGEEDEAYAAPDFTVYDGDGSPVKLSDFIGKPVVVNFWATWCGPCASELPAFDEVYAEYGDDVVFMMVNLTDGMRDTVSGVKAYVKEGGYSFPVYFDSDYSAASAYYVSSIPMTVFIDAEGNLVTGYIGALTKDIVVECVELIQGE